MIEWVGPDFGGNNVEVNADEMTVSIDGEVTKVDACNVIPAMKAGRICDMAGITEGNWAPPVIPPHTMQSRVDENIHVLGDASNQAICQNRASPPTARPRSRRWRCGRP